MSSENQEMDERLNVISTPDINNSISHKVLG